jgi:hypothetical protein
MASLFNAGCNADLRPALTNAQFSEIAMNCRLPSKARLDRQGRDHPMIILTGAGVSEMQVKCIHAEQDRLGATADMAN